MKILFFTPYFKPYIGGIERFVDEVSIRLLSFREVEEVTIITSNSLYKKGVQSEYKSFELDNGRKIYRLNFFPKDIPGIYHSYNAGFYSKELRNLLYLIKPDIIHFCKFEWFFPNLLVSNYCRKYNNKKIFFISYHPKRICLKHLPMVYFNKILLKSIDTIHVPTNIIREEISYLTDFPLNKIINIPLGVQIPLKKKIPHEKINIINVGRFNRRKGQYRLIKLFLSLPRIIQNQCNLILIGKDDGDLDKVKALAVNKTSIFIFENITDVQLQEFYLSSDIYATMSLDEVFGLSVFDAFSYGLATIAYYTHGNQEIGNKYHIGIFIEPNDEISFRKSLTKMIIDREFRLALGNDAKKCVAEKFTWDRTAKRILNLYKL